MSVIDSSQLLASGDDAYTISRSVRLRSSASAYFNRTLTTPTNNKIWTWSSWVKRGSLGSAQVLLSSDVGTSNTTWLEFGFDAADTFTVTSYTTDVNTTSAVFRDPSAWYHIVVAFDTTQATAANRCKIYVNGTQQTLTGAGFTLNAGYGINSAQAHSIGQRNWASGVGRYYDGYLAEINFVDGQALTPSSFGQYNAYGVWTPTKYNGTYGNNGFYLNFSDNSGATSTTIGKDYSGNGNNWTPNNISVTAGATYDSMLDTPTPYADGGNGRGNYAVLNPLDKGGSATATNGNIQFSGTGAGSIRSTIGMTSGKWYFESTFTATTGTAGLSIGGTSLAAYTGSVANEWSYGQNGQKITGGSGSAYGATFTAGDVIGVAFDADAGTLTFYKNGTSQGVAFTGLTSGPYFFTVGDNQTGAGQSVNFGQRPFAYTPPTGFKALNTFNLPDSTIKKGNQYFDATTYTGTSATQSIVNSGSMQPDLVWLKSRSNAQQNNLYDSVRGISAGGSPTIFSDSTSAETTYAGFGVSALNSNGFSVIGNGGLSNLSTYTYVAWQWQAGQGTTSSNTSGSITSTVSVNTTAGFSVVTYTGNVTAGATVGHGLGAAPNMMIVKRRDVGGTGWMVYHVSTGNTGYTSLESTAAFVTSSIRWNNTSPTSTVFTLGTSSTVNANAATYIAYCWAAVAGYSAFGSYTGNGSTDGPFVYLGFRPRFLLLKVSSTTGDWVIYDTSRNTYNVMDLYLYPDSSAAEAGSGTPRVDALSNGFKLRNTGQDNTSSATYIYAAFAENPFKYSLAR